MSRKQNFRFRHRVGLHRFNEAVILRHLSVAEGFLVYFNVYATVDFSSNEAKPLQQISS
jgi:hypothetical protein